MQRIAALNSRCVYREKSSITGDLVEAMAKATTEFAPLQFDQTGVDEDGREYRYASLAAINKATKKALADNGLWLHCDYGFDEGGIYAVVVLEHKTGQFVSSTLRELEAIPAHIEHPPPEGGDDVDPAGRD